MAERFTLPRKAREKENGGHQKEKEKGNPPTKAALHKDVVRVQVNSDFALNALRREWTRDTSYVKMAINK